MGSVSLLGTPGNAEALQALGEWLWDNHYSQHAVESIVGFAAVEGTPSGSPYLDREDEATATEVYCGAMPEVPCTDPAWDEYSFEPGRGPVYLTVESILVAGGLVPPELDDDAEDLEELEAEEPLPELEPYEPTAEEWEDYRRWARGIEARAAGLALPPVAGGGPGGPTEADVAEMHANDRFWEGVAEIRAAEDRAPLYGWE